MRRIGILRLASVLVGIVLGGVMLQGVISVASDNLLGEWALIGKSWKELLLVVAILLVAYEVVRGRYWHIYNTLVMRLAAGFALLHIVLLLIFHTGVLSTLAGILLDLRYIVIFVLCYSLVRLYPAARRELCWWLGGGIAIFLTFGLLQVFVLPPDFLSILGYSKATISPYLTVDQNESFVRINSTLRGPNPVGALALIVLALVATYSMWRIRVSRMTRSVAVALSAVAISALIILWHSYSRSALIGAVAALAILGVYYGYCRWGKVALGYGVIVLAVIGVAGAALYASPYGSIILAHEDPLEGNSVNSNEGHAASLAEGWDRFIHEPFGYGIGSVGSPSLLGENPLIIENQYFYIAHETGWLGIGLFLVLFGALLYQLGRRRRDWLALAVFASGIGLAVVGVVLPVWADDTIALVWWGLAGIALASGYNKKHARTLN